MQIIVIVSKKSAANAEFIISLSVGIGFIFINKIDINIKKVNKDNIKKVLI